MAKWFEPLGHFCITNPPSGVAMDKPIRLFKNERANKEENIYLDKDEGIKLKLNVDTEMVKETEFTYDYVMIGNGIRVTSLDKVNEIIDVFGGLNSFKINPLYIDKITNIEKKYLANKYKKEGRRIWQYLLLILIPLLVPLALILLSLSK